MSRARIVRRPWVLKVRVRSRRAVAPKHQQSKEIDAMRSKIDAA
jgi:hypothetical protein